MRSDDDAGRDRDVALDLVRGLAMAILVVNHLRMESALGHVTGALLSAAEVLVSVSGVVVGMVFGRRWLVHGARATAATLLRRARKLYAASVVVVALVGALALVPGLGTDALTVSPTMRPAQDLYAFDGAARTLLAILTLEAGPWQFSILGFFIVVLAAAPAVLFALERGWWPVVLLTSWGLFVVGREWGMDVLPTQSERPFPVLVWQVLFVNGMVIGWHRERIAVPLRARRGIVSAAVVAVAALCAGLQVVGPLLFDAGAWTAWEARYFDKGTLDLARLVAMVSIAAALYAAFRHAHRLRRALAPLLLPLGRNSFYVFIMHVFVCLAVASLPVFAGGDGLGLAGNTLVQIACVALLWEMARRRFLFRWVPR